MAEEYDNLFPVKRRSATFKERGKWVKGVVLSEPQEMQRRDYAKKKPMFWEDGKPKMQTVFRLQTDERLAPDEDYPDEDNGQRGLFAHGNKLKAVREAIRASGAKNRSDLVGATIEVAWVSSQRIPGVDNPSKVYDARITLNPDERTRLIAEAKKSENSSDNDDDADDDF